MDGLVDSWKASLQLCKPKNFKAFMLVTLNACLQTAKALIFGAGPILLGFIVVFGVGGYGLMILLLWWRVPVPFILGFLLQIAMVPLFMCVCLAARPSTSRKDVRYFIDYLMGRWYVLLGIVFISASSPVLVGAFLDAFPGEVWSLLKPLVVFWVKPLVVFWVLFACDERPGVGNLLRATARAVTMFVYNLPVCLLVSVTQWLPGGLLTLAAVWTSGIIWSAPDIPTGGNIFSIGLAVVAAMAFVGGLSFFVTVLCVNLYIKWTHDRPELYLPGPKQSDS